MVIKHLWGGYKIEKKIFWSMFFVLLLFTFVSVLAAPKAQFYFNCPLSYSTFHNGLLVNGCENPFYNTRNSGLIPDNPEIITSGSTYGKPFEIPFFYKNFNLWVFLIVASGFLINHYKNNRGVKK